MVDDLTLKDLKEMAYDTLVQIERLQRKMQELNQEIAKRNNEAILSPISPTSDEELKGHIARLQSKGHEFIGH